MASQSERVGGRIRELREVRGWLQRELADRMRELGDEGIRESVVSATEKGRRLPQEDRLGYFAAALETTTPDLYAGPEADRVDAGGQTQLDRIEVGLGDIRTQLQLLLEAAGQKRLEDAAELLPRAPDAARPGTGEGRSARDSRD